MIFALTRGSQAPSYISVNAAGGKLTLIVRAEANEGQVYGSSGSFDMSPQEAQQLAQELAKWASALTA